ncbi:MAG TPA: N-acetylmuramoyl-L-alanine amidase [Pseudomonadota bacterium]|nr:N-acetylmuramoyl-L-alanine amidase [Deltaproteobacteria bacterium]HPH27678.1 N-acetylmuramoyl-L-alanine amidase [Pseudomonadota bacterium]
MRSKHFIVLAGLGLGLSMVASGCGGQLENNVPADESEYASTYVITSLAVGGQATVFNTGGVGVNMRTGAGTGYSVIKTIPEGETVSIIGGPTASFWKVRHGTNEGWSHENFLKEKVSGTGGGAYPSGIKWDAASSSNYTASRGASVSRVIIHDMEGRYDGAISWFKNPASQVSAHYCIRSSDGDITQMVAEGHTAWHAGNWTYNQTSIGIEHEGWKSDPGRWYTDAMYRRSGQLTAAITKRYGIAVDRTKIIGHSEVPPPNTHTDPGTGWDWNKYMGYVRSFR